MKKQTYKQLLITTSVDKLVEAVRKRGKLTIKQAASLMGVEEDLVSGWVDILEDNNILKLVFPPIGEPVIVLARPTEKQVIAKKVKIEKGVKKIEERGKKFEKKVGEVEIKAKESEEEFERLKGELEKDLKHIEKDLKHIEKMKIIKKGRIKKITPRSISGISKAMDLIDAHLNSITRDMKRDEEEVKKLDSEKEKLENEITALEREMKIVESLVKKPIKIPVFGTIKRKFKGHKGKTEKVKKRKEEVKKKVEKVKKEVKKKKKRKISLRRIFIGAPKKSR